MAEAVIRLQTAAGALDQTVKAIKTNTAAVLQDLKRIDPAVADASRRLEQYQQKLQQTGTLNPAERLNVEQLQQFVARRVEAATAQAPAAAVAAAAIPPPPVTAAAPPPAAAGATPLFLRANGSSQAIP